MADKNSGIIDPPIDELLSKVDSKYQLVIWRARLEAKITSWYLESTFESSSSMGGSMIPLWRSTMVWLL